MALKTWISGKKIVSQNIIHIATYYNLITSQTVNILNYILIHVITYKNNQPRNDYNVK